MKDMLEGLTESQLEAVTHRDGPMLVIAGAGSGKTRVVTCRIAYLISNGVWPSQILAMTFTNKAAREMRERVEAMTGEQARQVGTFHSCCARFLRRDIELLGDGRTRDFTIYDTSEQQATLKKALEADNLKLPPGLTPRGMQALISQAKGQRRAVLDLACANNYQNPELIAKCAASYEARLRQCNAVDFDDLLLLMADVLERFPEQREIYHNRFRYVLIDEYQDTNHLQYELMRLLVGPGDNIHVTGDPDQSIYSWRGADYSNIMSFTKDYPNARVVTLERNYRSTQTILDVANELIEHNLNRYEKSLYTENMGGYPVYDVTVGTDRQEADWICRSILSLNEEGNNLRDMAVFYRTNSQSRALEEAFVTNQIPYQLIGGLRFYERKEVKDFLALLRILVNPNDLVSLERVAGLFGKGVGSTTLTKVMLAARAHGMSSVELLAHKDFATLYGGRATPGLRRFAELIRSLRSIPLSPVSEAAEMILDISGLKDLYSKEIDDEERIANIEEFVGNVNRFGAENPDGDLAQFLEEVSLVADIDSHDEESDFVTLMTLHSSKGLEFPYVYIAGVEEGLLPHSNALGDPETVEEERRIFYVGITRAKRGLVLLHSQTRFLWNRRDYRRPSRFLAELPEDIVTRLFYGVRGRKK
ncbi:MAG: UvrD-helicase domain-containing protein [Lentisphaerae bacterium]|jgi:DNA helicase-2/ATP-dependent DNA helicase PcrA|nr:UvrD-helicase domain-containing protein [Lentisphaerota bacterium]